MNFLQDLVDDSPDHNFLENMVDNLGPKLNVKTQNFMENLYQDMDNNITHSPLLANDSKGEFVNSPYINLGADQEEKKSSSSSEVIQRGLTIGQVEAFHLTKRTTSVSKGTEKGTKKVFINLNNSDIDEKMMRSSKRKNTLKEPLDMLGKELMGAFELGEDYNRNKKTMDFKKQYGDTSESSNWNRSELDKLLLNENSFNNDINNQ